MPVDGDIVLTAGLSADDAISTAEMLTDEIREIFEAAAGTSTSTAFKSLQIQMDGALSKSQHIRDSMDELANTEFPTDAYAQLESQLSEIDEEYARLTELRHEYEQRGEIDTQSYQDLEVQLQKLEEAGLQVRETMQSMQDSGTATFTGDQTEEYQRLGEQLNQVNNRLVILRQRALESGNSSTQSARNASSAYNRLGNTITKVNRGVSKSKNSFGSFAGNTIKRLTGQFKSLDGAAENSKRTVQRFFKTFIKYAFGVRSFFFLFRKLRSAVIDGFGNLAQVSKPFNAAMSSMQNTLAGLKSSFASAFAPIIQAVAPAITTFINHISNAVDAVGKLIAALTGQKTYIKYIATQQDYAQSVNDTANSANKASKATDKANKSAKKYQKTLAGFDDINILKEPDNDTNSGTGSSGGSDSGGKLSPVAGVVNTPLSEAFTDLSTKLKEAWKNADFTEIGTIVGTKLKEALDNIPWPDIKTTLWQIARSAATFLNGFFETPGLFSSIGSTIAQAFNSILIFVYTFVSTLNWKSIGKAVVQGIVAFFKIFNWKLFGATLWALISGLLDFLQGVVDELPWEEIPDAVTTAISDFLEGFDWKDLLNKTIGIIKSALDGLIEMISGKEGENKDSPLVKALQSLKESVGRIDPELFEKLGTAIGRVVDALGPIAEGFGAGFIAFFSKLIDFGIDVLNGLGDVLNDIADVLGGMDPDTLEKVGIALGIIAGAFITMNTVSGFISALAGIIGGIGAASAGASASISGVGSALAGVGLSTLGATVGLAGFFAILKTETVGESEEDLASLHTTMTQVEFAVGQLGLKYGWTKEQMDAITEPMRNISETDGPAMQQAFKDIETNVENAGGSTADFKTELNEVASHGITGTAFTNISKYLGGISKSAKDADTDTTGLSEAFGLFSAPNFSAILKLALLKGAVDALGSSGKLSEEDTAKLQKTLDDYDASPTEENMGKIQKAMEDAGVSAGDLNTAYIEAVKTLPDELKPEYTKLASTITTQNKQTKSKMKEGGEDIVQGAIEGVENKEEDLSSKMDSVVWDDIVGPFDNAADIQSPSKVMKLRGQYLLDGLKNGISSRTSIINALMRTTVDGMNKIVAGFAGAFKSSGVTLMQNLYSGLLSYQYSLTTLVADIADDMLDSFDDDDWWTVGYNAAVGMYNGFVSLDGKLQRMVYQVASNMLAAAENALDIGSPSKRFAWIGEMTMLGLAGGITDNEGQPIGAISDITDDMEDAAENADLGVTFNTKLADLLDTFDLILTDFSDTIIERFDALIGSLAILSTPAFATIPNIASGRIVPYSINSASSGNSQVADLKSAINEMNNNRLTREDIMSIVTTALRNMPIDLYIGDEQIARHANTGNAKLSRRFS